MKRIVFTFLMMSVALPVWGQTTGTPEGTAWVNAHGYTGVVKLFNAHTTVLLDPNCGGRVLEYTLDGNTAIYLNPEHDGWTWEPGGQSINPSGGRCDIGPEKLVPRRNLLWLGKWTAEITGPRSARLTSQEDPSPGVQLIRDFVLDDDSSHLQYTQTIINISDETKHYNHWSRTFATGGGICIVPLTELTRFPKGFVIYGPGNVIQFQPDAHPSIRTRDSFLEVIDTPPQPKFGIDSYAGWFSYITRDNMMFVKKFPVYPDRVYGELAAYTISLWYFEDTMCELEPIGPRETIPPGGRSSFTEDWWLLPYQYPEDKTVDLDHLSQLVESATR